MLLKITQHSREVEILKSFVESMLRSVEANAGRGNMQHVLQASSEMTVLRRSLADKSPTQNIVVAAIDSLMAAFLSSISVANTYT